MAWCLAIVLIVGVPFFLLGIVIPTVPMIRNTFESRAGATPCGGRSGCAPRQVADRLFPVF